MYKDMQGNPWDRNQDQELRRKYNDTHDLYHLANHMGRSEHAVHCRLIHLEKKGELVYKEEVPQPTKEKKIVKSTKVTTRTFIGEELASTFSVERIVNAMEDETAFVKRLGLLSPSKTITKLSDQHKANIIRLEAVLADAINND